MYRMATQSAKLTRPGAGVGLDRSQWLVLIAAFLGWMFDGLEQGVFPLVARPALQDLLGVEADQQIGPWMGYITALFLVGAAFGGLTFGWLGIVWACPGDDSEHYGLLDIYGMLLLRSGAVAAGSFPFSRRCGHGRRMVAGSCAGDGMLA
jgi:MFS family permease